MTLKEFKNYNDIKNSTSQIRGEVLNPEDIDLIWIGEPKPFINEDFLSDQDVVELSVYDMDDNIIMWETVPAPYDIVNTYDINKIVLSPGKDLRRNGFQRGQYRLVYNFLRNIVGSSNSDKLYIEAISPSRKEIRVRPVKVANPVQNAVFNNMVSSFSNIGSSKQLFKTSFETSVKSLVPSNIIQDSTSQEFLQLKQTIGLLQITTITKVFEAIDSFDKDILSINDQERIIRSVGKAIFVAAYGDEWEQGISTGIFNPYLRVIQTFVITDDRSNLDYYVNFGNGNLSLVTKWVRDDIAFPNQPYSIVFKLYEPLSKDIKEKQQLWISKIMTTPVIEKVFLLGQMEDEVEEGNILKPANFDVNIIGISGRTTGYESWTSLLSTEPSTSEDILNTYFSASDMGDISLNINYSDYYNFINFGSATERLKNFKYKLELMDTYSENIKKLNTYTSSLYISQSVSGFLTKIRQVKNGFDSYEKHLYFQSGSFYSGSLLDGSQHFLNKIHEWPKQNTTRPYSLYPLTSSVALTWYGDQLAIAERFDRDNIHNFTNNLPSYILTDVNNEDYLTFMYMIGQHFDIMFTYIKQLTLISNRDESLYEGLAKDLTYNVAQSFGFDLWNGNDNTELWRWAFGYNETGSYNADTISGSNEVNLPYGDVSKEIWRRILNNMPYIMKTKGTSRSIKALLSCYGIPTSLLTIREYGGPDPRDYENIQDKSAYIFEDFVYSLDFQGGQNIVSTWSQLTASAFPETIEFRFASALTSSVTQSLVNTTNWAINLLYSGSGFGYLQFAITDGSSEWSMKTDKYRYYDNEFNSVMLRYSGSDTLELWTKKAEVDRIIFYSSASINLVATASLLYFTADDLIIGGDTANTWGNQFTGSMQEFKMYQTALSESTWDNHVRWPKSYNSNEPRRTFNDLVLRYSMDDPKNHASDTTLSDVKSDQSFTNAGTAEGFASKINYTPVTEEFAALSPQIGGGRFINNKIRIESNELIGQLSPENRVELAGFDRSPVDSAKLGIYFTPLDAINRDIMATFAGIDLSGEIGDPRDRFNDHYTKLKILNTEYWKKYTSVPQYNDFIRTIKQYDQSFFNQLRALIPARVKPIIGILIEPHILERNKYAWKPLTKERNDYEANSIKFEQHVTHSWEYESREATIIITFNTQSEYLTYDTAVLDTGFSETSSYYVGEQQYIPMINPIQDMETGSFDIRKRYVNYSSSFSLIGDSSRLKGTTYWFNSGSGLFHIIYDLKIDNWLHEYRELEFNLWYSGTKNTIETTIDGKEPVEVHFTNPNKLKSTTTGPSKIRVE